MIDPRMTFYTVQMFFERSGYIKEFYQNLNTNEKYMYKYYVYSRRSIGEKTCDSIWSYLNAPDGSLDSFVFLGEVKKAYKALKKIEGVIDEQ